ncbi:hypothetical protein GCM10010433_56750 [Streptomyces pulveraceus]|uniref:Uncharacterized protein n=1 Tax=Streptomyces pulveraceus TaxID=68258 RepID=A0ABW1GTR3_9ACTN
MTGPARGGWRQAAVRSATVAAPVSTGTAPSRPASGPAPERPDRHRADEVGLRDLGGPALGLGR